MRKYMYRFHRLILLSLTCITVSFAAAACSKPANSPLSAEAVTPELTPTAVPTETLTPTPTTTPKPTATPIPTPTATPEPTPTPVPTPTAIPEPTPTTVPTVTATPIPTKKPSPTPAIYAVNGVTNNLPKFSGYSYAIADAESKETLLSYNGEKII